MPHIGDAHAKLSEMVAEAQSLLMERSVHEARAQELSRRFDEIIESGRKTATFMRIDSGSSTGRTTNGSPRSGSSPPAAGSALANPSIRSRRRHPATRKADSVACRLQRP